MVFILSLCFGCSNSDGKHQLDNHVNSTGTPYACKSPLSSERNVDSSSKSGPHSLPHTRAFSGTLESGADGSVRKSHETMVWGNQEEHNPINSGCKGLAGPSSLTLGANDAQRHRGDVQASSSSRQSPTAAAAAPVSKGLLIQQAESMIEKMTVSTSSIDSRARLHHAMAMYQPTASPATSAQLLQEIQQLAWLGSGASGVVYSGIWQGAPVAVKFIVSNNFHAQLESTREAVLSKAVGHPCVVHTYTYHVSKITPDMLSVPRTSNSISHGFLSTAGFAQDLLEMKLDSLVDCSPCQQVSDSEGNSSHVHPLPKAGFSTKTSCCKLPECIPMPGTQPLHTVSALGDDEDRPGGCGPESSPAAAGPASLVVCSADSATIPHKPNGGSRRLKTASLTCSRPSSLGNLEDASPTGMQRPQRPKSLLSQGFSGDDVACPSYWRSPSGVLGGENDPPAPASKSGGNKDSGALASMYMRSLSLGVMNQEAKSPGLQLAEALQRLGARPGQYLTVLIMEKCEGPTLLQAIQDGSFRSLDGSRSRAMLALLQTTRDIALGCHHLHSLNIIHGDLKPSNVLLKDNIDSWGRGFHVKVSDFGLARHHEEQESLGQDAPANMEGLGTVAYMAPEVLDGQQSKASDVYSYGVLLWQMCSGTPPYSHLRLPQILLGTKLGTISLQWPEGVLPALQKLGAACLDRNTSNRPTFEYIANTLTKAVTQFQARIINKKSRKSSDREAGNSSTSASNMTSFSSTLTALLSTPGTPGLAHAAGSASSLPQPTFNFDDVNALGADHAARSRLSTTISKLMLLGSNSSAFSMECKPSAQDASLGSNRSSACGSMPSGSNGLPIASPDRLHHGEGVLMGRPGMHGGFSRQYSTPTVPVASHTRLSQTFLPDATSTSPTVEPFLSGDAIPWGSGSGQQ